METSNSCSTTALSTRKRSSLMVENCRLLLAPCHLKKCCGLENLVPLEGNRFFKNTKRELCCLPGWDLPHFQRREIPEPPIMRNSSPCISGKHPVTPWQHLDHQVWWHLPCCLIVQWLLSSAAFSWSSLIGFWGGALPPAKKGRMHL